jgi:thiol-disulfide isomerase/thioredoxin
MSRARVRLLGWVLLTGVAIAALAVFGLAGEHAPRQGRLAPELPRERLIGPTRTLQSMLAAEGGRSALVIFWASWCGPCEHEAPAVERFSQSAEGRGRVVGVDWSDGLSGARTFLRRYAWTFPNVRDAEGTVGNAYRMSDLPTTFVLDGHGHIRKVLRGPQTERSLAAALRTA